MPLCTITLRAVIFYIKEYAVSYQSLIARKLDTSNSVIINFVLGNIKTITGLQSISLVCDFRFMIRIN